jgi:hypothetical protein
VARERNFLAEQNPEQVVRAEEVAGKDLLETGALVIEGGLLACLVSSGLADRGENFFGDPPLEQLRLRLSAGEDKAIEARFVDDVDFLRTAKGPNNSRPPFVVIEAGKGFRWIR